MMNPIKDVEAEANKIENELLNPVSDSNTEPVIIAEKITESIETIETDVKNTFDKVVGKIGIPGHGV